jgi:hypothetical protein
MENNCQSFQFYPLCTVLFFQLCFFHNENEDDVLILKTCMQACGYYVPRSEEETEYISYFSTTLESNRCIMISI